MPRLRAYSVPDATELFAPLADHQCIALAVSGGADSLGLMLLAHLFADATGRHARFVVYSVDHGLRPEAADEAAFVVREAKARGFLARALRWDGPKPQTGVQEAAREARYRLFAAAMARDGASVLVTAHHLHDQAETVLMRLSHGSGLGGLRGMDYESQVGGITIVRPLLGVDPAALRALVADAGLTPVEDPSNTSLDYERVRWRQMLPQLAALGLTAERLALFSERARDADRTLAMATAAAWREVETSPDRRLVVFERGWLQALPRAIAVRVMERALGEVGGWRKPHGLGPVEALTDRLRREPARATLHGCVISAGRRRVTITPEAGRRRAESAAAPAVEA